MTLRVPDPPVSDVVSWAVEAFEAAVALDPHVEVSAFIPLPSYPHRREVIAELVRVDMELGWRRGEPTPLAEYLLRFPALLEEKDTLNSVAYEEYRQRRLRSEAIHPTEYANRYGIDVTLWPPILPRTRPVVRVEDLTPG